MTCFSNTGCTTDIHIKEESICILPQTSDIPMLPNHHKQKIQYSNNCDNFQNEMAGKIALNVSSAEQLETSFQPTSDCEAGNHVTETCKYEAIKDEYIKEETLQVDAGTMKNGVEDTLTNDSGSESQIDDKLFTWVCPGDTNLKSFSVNSAEDSIAEQHVDVPVYNGRNQCIVCLTMFDTYYALRKHKAAAHAQSREHKCPICLGDQLYKTASLANHMKSHSVQKPYVCGICSSTFSNKRPLYNHMAQTHGDQASMYNCEDCGKHFNMLSSFRRHARIHTGEKPFACQLCTKTFNSSTNLHRHVKIHFENTDMSFGCNMCQKVFAQRTDLERHQRIHSGDKPYACNYCTKRFTQNSHLQRHVAMHSSFKPYRCDMCLKGFREDLCLQHHKKSHLTSPPYSCSVCNKQFQSDANLQAHLKIHSSERRFLCQMCDRYFKRSSHLHVHMRKHTGEKPYQCDDCDKSFAQLTDLNRHRSVHVNEHTYTCGVCRAEFSEANLLESHLEIHTVQTSHSMD